MEECDTGMPAGGTGCDKDCKVESGWVCTATNPSSCQRSNSPSGGGGGGSGGGGGGGPTPDHHRGHGGDPYAPPSNNHSKKNHGGGAVVGILLSLVLVGVLAAGYLWRGEGVRHVPWSQEGRRRRPAQVVPAAQPRVQHVGDRC